MSRKVALILSLMPISPVKSGMQNTIFFLHKYLAGSSAKFPKFTADILPTLIIKKTLKILINKQKIKAVI